MRYLEAVFRQRKEQLDCLHRARETLRIPPCGTVGIQTLCRRHRRTKRMLLPRHADSMERKQTAPSTALDLARTGDADGKTTVVTREEYAETIRLSDVVTPQDNGFVSE